MTPMIDLPVELEQYLPKIEIVADSGCWAWRSTVNSKGYGTIFTSRLAHRVFYEHMIGRIPDGLVIDHLCRCRNCVNPAHLEAVTTGENTRRGLAPSMIQEFNSLKTHCPAGHEYTEENTSYKTNAKGVSRHCRICARDNARARRGQRD